MGATMITRKLGPLAAALGVAAAILSFTHGALGQSSQPNPAPADSAASAPTAGWHTMTGPDRSFTADLPAAPKYTTTPMRTSAGSGYTMHQYLLEQGAVAYVVQTAVYPADVNVSNHRANLQGGLDNAAKNMEGGKWASVGWVTHQGLTAVDAVGVRGEPRHPLLFGDEGTADRHPHLRRPRRVGAVGRRRPVHRPRCASAQ